MTTLRRAANGYDYVSYESEYLKGDWDIIPATYGQTKKENRLRLIENDSNVVRRVHPETLKKRKKAALYCGMIFLIFAVMVAVVYRYAVISEMHIENTKREQKIEELTTQVESIEVSMNTTRDLNGVMMRAEELGMDFAGADSVEYLEINYLPQE